MIEKSFRINNVIDINSTLYSNPTITGTNTTPYGNYPWNSNFYLDA